MDIAVLGAYGAVGRELLAELAARGHTGTAVGRDPVRLGAVAADRHVTAGTEDSAAIRELAASHDAVINTTGVERAGLAREVTAAGAAFADISAASAYLSALRGTDAPAQPVIAGIGLAPGLTNVLAASVPGADPIRIGILAGAGEAHGPAARAWIWGSAGARVGDGAGGTYRVYRPRARMTVPGFGRRAFVRAAFGEQDQLRATQGRDVSTWLALDPAVTTATLALAGYAPGTAAYLDRVSGPLTHLMASRDRWAVVVERAGTPYAWASGRRQTTATAVLTALAIDRLRAAPPRVYAAHELLTLDGIADDLARGGISTGLRGQGSAV